MHGRDECVNTPAASFLLFFWQILFQYYQLIKEWNQPIKEWIHIATVRWLANYLIPLQTSQECLIRIDSSVNLLEYPRVSGPS